jgi:hypothetical protein
MNRSARPSQKPLEFFPCHVAIIDYFGQQTRTDCFTRMNRHHSATPISMPYKVVTTPDPGYVESSFSKCSNNGLPVDGSSRFHRDSLNPDKLRGR